MLVENVPIAKHIQSTRRSLEGLTVHPLHPAVRALCRGQTRSHFQLYIWNAVTIKVN